MSLTEIKVKKIIKSCFCVVPSGSDTFVEVGMPRSPSHSANGIELKQMLASCKTSSGKRQALELLQGTKNSHLQYVWIDTSHCSCSASLLTSFTANAVAQSLVWNSIQGPHPSKLILFFKSLTKLDFNTQSEGDGYFVPYWLCYTHSPWTAWLLEEL